MPLRSDPLDELQIPDGTTVEEHDLVTDGDVIVGGQSAVEFGVRGHTVIGGERVRFGGDIEAEGDCRLDMWSDVDGNVLVGENAYLGERVHVAGQLMVSGDLDIGDDVDIEEGFEANGWIVIRNPMPTIVFLFVYLSHLLRIGEEEAAADVMSELTDTDADHDPVLIPRNSRVSDDAWRVSTPATIGDGCRLHGNVRAASLDVGADNEVFGSLRAREDVVIGTGTEIHGDVTTRDGTVRVTADAHVWGDVAANDVELHEDAVIEGSIRARGEMTMIRGDDRSADPTASADAAAEPQDDEATSDEQSADDEPQRDDVAAGDEPTDETDDDEPQDDEQQVDDEPQAETDDDDAQTGSPTDDETVEQGTERVTADGSDPHSGDEYRENGHEDPAELVE
ncbi:MAG: polymer-forming cytoskeletal protein [Haloarculaceae archaeon]